MSLPRTVWGGLLLLVVVMGAALRLESVPKVAKLTMDESRYDDLSATAMQRGTAGLRQESALYHDGGEHAVFDLPSPDRVAFLYVRGWFGRIFHMDEPVTGRWFSAWVDIAVLVLLGLGLWRLAGPMQAVVAAALYAGNAPALVMARHGWQESFVELLGVAMLFCAARAMEGRAKSAAALGVLTGLALTVKSTLFLNGVLLAAIVLVVLVRRKLPGKGALVGGLALAAAAGIVWLGAVLGGVGQVLFFFQGERMQGNSYAITFQTGTLEEWIGAVFQLEPFTVCLAVGCVVWVAVECWRKRELRVSLPMLAAVVAAVGLALPLTAEHGKNLRFAALAFAPLCLLAGECVERVWRWMARRLSVPQIRVAGAVAGIYLLFAVGYSVWQFRTELEQPDLQDLSIGYLR